MPSVIFNTIYSPPFMGGVWGWVFCGVVFAVLTFLFYRHQSLLRDRAHLMREAVRNHEFTFSLPTKGLFFGERALQEALNDIGQEVNKLVAQNEVESWQRLTRVLTHEIMNATTPIQSISQAYLSNPKIKGTVYEEGIRAIFETSNGLASFVDSYRKLTQLQKPVLEEVGIGNLVSSIKTLYPDLEWRISLPPFTTMTVDENMLRQVLINLVKNAVEAGAKMIDVHYSSSLPLGHSGSLPTGEGGGRGRLFISNDGAPIPADARREIFVPFFTTKRTGSGIGLSLSRQMMMMQGMNIVLAETPVSGCHVTFVIGND
jgi:nitrogen fixation/metabolism regulation signal transduction histidine kinase